ncbi:Multi-copper polyphenol oxidoreductase, laccase [Desulfovibrio sp. X2]|uniref:polyphenol oxidase family protein n=1 Tax=Desulfovibrio sp. X2 TaxID=941449 RepID=UPI000358AE78|nr:polyphenol oxidase family protein [Desulfovibrio sp. X2]EPR41413.1 Multi-copper polyphenol oxidoreductase, laccase [Desulfovibrio sp. X2]
MKNIPTPFCIPFAFPGVPGVRCVFGTRIGGYSGSPFDKANVSLDVGDDPAKVRSNRQAIKQEQGFTFWQELRQVHGTDMVFDPEPRDIGDGPTGEGDGLATSLPGQALVIKTADCQPILLAHASGKYVAALHVGWRGNVQNFPGRGVAAFCAHYGLDPADVLAVRGPSLGPAASEFVNFADEFGDDFKAFHDEAKKTVDLWRLTRLQLREAGLRPGNIFGLDLCTHSLADAFFSYRRREKTGRQASIVWIRG